MGQNPNRTPSEHPNPTTKIGSKMVVPSALTHGHMSHESDSNRKRSWNAFLGIAGNPRLQNQKDGKLATLSVTRPSPAL